MDSLFTKVPDTGKIEVRYDICGGNHLVYVGQGENVKRITFDSGESAVKFYQSISAYNSLKENI